MGMLETTAPGIGFRGCRLDVDAWDGGFPQAVLRFGWLLRAVHRDGSPVLAGHEPLLAAGESIPGDASQPRGRALLSGQDLPRPCVITAFKPRSPGRSTAFCFGGARCK